MDRQRLDDRRLDVMLKAAERYERSASRVESTTAVIEASGRMAATPRVILNDFLIREFPQPRRTTENFLHERVVGSTNDLMDTAPDAAAQAAGRPVARIVEIGADGSLSGFASGFLVTPGLVVTNWHVFDSSEDVLGCGAQFGYELSGGRVAEGAVFELDAAQFFISNEALDIAIVGVRPTAAVGRASLDEFGFVPVDPGPGKYIAGNPINIIQYPEGLPKRWATTENGLKLTPDPDDLFLQYSTDTEPGSSGSPAFNHAWELVAVHHSGVPRLVDGRIVTTAGTFWDKSMSDTEIDWVANEGVRISKIHALLSKLRLADATQQSLLDQFLRQVTSESARISREGFVENPPPARPTAGAAPGQSAVAPQIMNVVVNGTANFYLAGGLSAVPERPLPPVPPTPSIAPTLVEKALRFDPDYRNRPGYQRDFLAGFSIKAPSAPVADVLKSGSSAKVLKYHHYSVVMHKDRKLAVWTAANADYDPAKRRHDRDWFGTDTWKADPRIPGEDQLEDLEFYAPAKKFDRGHLVRRDDVAWGVDETEEIFGNSDSFHWTNCSPQHEHFNRAVGSYQGLWGRLENHISKQLNTKRCILFAGPVLADDDPIQYFHPDLPVQVPVRFWKIVVAVDEKGSTGKLRAYGFVLSQQPTIDEYGWEAKQFDPARFKEEQTSLKDITERARVTFEKELHDADPLAVTTVEGVGRRPLRSLGDVVLR